MADGPYISDQELLLFKLVQMNMQTNEVTLNLNMLCTGLLGKIWLDALAQRLTEPICLTHLIQDSPKLSAH